MTETELATGETEFINAETERENLEAIRRECMSYNHTETRAKVVSEISKLINEKVKSNKLEIVLGGHLGEADAEAVKREIEEYPIDNLVLALEFPGGVKSNLEYEQLLNTFAQGSAVPINREPLKKEVYFDQIQRLVAETQVEVICPDPLNSEAKKYSALWKSTEVISSGDESSVDEKVEANFIYSLANRISQLQRDLSIAKSLIVRMSELQDKQLLFHVGELHFDIPNILREAGLPQDNIHVAKQYEYKMQPESFYYTDSLRTELSDQDKKILLINDIYTFCLHSIFMNKAEDGAPAVGHEHLLGLFEDYVDMFRKDPSLVDKFLNDYFAITNTAKVKGEVSQERLDFVYEYFFRNDESADE